MMKTPTAWMRGVRTPSTPDGPEEWDTEFSYGDDRPDGDSWVPLYRAALEAEDGGWLPIETAPKDGTHVIVGTFPCEPGQITTTVAHWFDARDYGAKSGLAGWALSVNYDGEHSDHGVESPTHWQPLPAAPTQGEGE